MTLRARRISLTAMIAIAACAAGCGQRGQAPANSTGVGSAEGPLDPSTAGAHTLEVWTAESATRLDLVKRRAAEFMTRYPNIKVVLTVRDFDSYPAQLKLALTSDSAPDVAIGNLGWSLDGPLIKAGLLRDLGPWAGFYGWDRRFSAACQRQMRFSLDGRDFGKGALFGVPYAADLIGWFYNSAKLRALKLEPPKTFAELESAFAAAKAAGEVPIMLGNRAQWPGLHVFYTISDTLAAPREINGLAYGDKTVSWQSAHFIASGARLAAWNSQGYFAAGVNGMTPADANARFAKGEGVFLPAGTWNAAELSKAMGGDVGFFLTPPERADEPRRATGSFGYGWHITKSSKQAGLAAAFIEFMSNDDWARELFAAGDIAPFAPANLSAQPAAPLAGEIRRAWSELLAHDTLLPYLDSSAPNGAEVIYPIMQSILAGQVEPARGMADIEASRQQFLATLQ